VTTTPNPDLAKVLPEFEKKVEMRTKKNSCEKELQITPVTYSFSLFFSKKHPPLADVSVPPHAVPF
jgi:hypothetical protein